VRAAFFKTGRENFFHPITGPWREVIVQLVIVIYDSFLGGGRRSAHYIDRADLKDMAVDAIQDYPVVSAEFDEVDRALSLKDEATKASEIVRRLQQFGWIETFEDPGTRREVYRFTRLGKNAAQWLTEQDSPALRMTQRNVRNTKHSLRAYKDNGDAYDLFMAFDHSQRITHDLADDVAEIHERRRAIIAESIHEIALLDYVQYMNGKFAPVTAVKLRADSVYRHEQEVREIVSAIKQLDREKLNQLEQGARVFRSESGYEGSIVLKTLNEIEANLSDAMDNKMHELAAAVSEYTDRTSFLALQASVIASTGSASALNRTLDAVGALEGEAQDAALGAMTARLSPFRIALVDESIVRLRKGSPRAKIQTVQEVRLPTRQERLSAFVQKAEERAFSISVKDIRERLESAVHASLRSEVLLSEIEVNTYDDLLLLTHAVEAAANPEFGAQKLTVAPLDGVRRSNAYVEFDEMAIQPRSAKPSATTHRKGDKRG